jgi:hypothetical protein
MFGKSFTLEKPLKYIDDALPNNTKGYRFQLIYDGINNNTLKITYREFIDNLQFGDLLPISPIPSTSNIRSIKFKKDLVLEGAQMGHCVASYYPEVIKGAYFVYRILTPQIATLGMIYRNGKLTIDQIKLQDNQAPSKSTVFAVQQWLDKHEKGFRVV